MMNELQTNLFSYEAMPSSVAGNLQLRKERIRGIKARAVFEMGRELFEAQEEMAKAGCGNFIAWMEQEAEIEQRTGYNLINVYKNIDHDSLQNLQRLVSKSVLYAISAPSTPESVRAEVIDRAESGEKITLAEVEELKRRARAAEDQAQAERDARLAAEGTAKGRQNIIDLLQQKLDAKPEPEVVERVVEKEITPPDYEDAKRKAAKLDELRDDLEAANQSLCDLRAKQARAIEDGVREGLRARQSEIDRMERHQADLERRIAIRKADAESYDADRASAQDVISAVSKLALDIGGFAATLGGIEFNQTPPGIHDQLDRAEYLLSQAQGAIDMLRNLPVHTVERDAA